MDEKEAIKELKEAYPIDLLTKKERKIALDLSNKYGYLSSIEYIKSVRKDFGLKSSKIYYDLYIKVREYTDIEQGKKLAEILSLESADMWYHGHDSHWESERRYDKEPSVCHSMHPNWDAPCWSLGALLERLPMPALIQDKADDGLFWQCSVYNEEGEEICETYASDKVDACYEMIIHLNELNLL